MKMWSRRLGIIPYRKNVEFALDNKDTCSIGSNQKGNFLFHGWYRPHFAYRDFSMRGKIVITYRIYAKSDDPDDGKYFDTGLRKIPISFKDSVEYSKIGD
jgi:hypothetical protein